ncbi:MAG: NAD(P)/FAD-dependent oxidoreductase [Clostridia bacterium]|nr:NAD(P)/FAD-dependent oxidoreductase [Clostridia bacterium]
MFDVAVIGGGVIGGAVARELVKYQLNVCILEKQADVAMGQSRANSGIVHAGFDAVSGSLKAKFNVLGNQMMEDLSKELGVKFKRNGSLVVAFSQEEMNTLSVLKERGEKNGVSGLTIINRERLVELEPNISKNAVGALLAPTGGIICPYKLTIALIGNAMDNGATLYTDFDVAKIQKDGENFILLDKTERKVNAKIIINCAGIYSQEIANLAGDYSFTVGGRKGEYILLDRECQGFVNSTLFFTPTEKGKGILVSPTVDGNIILGPTAQVVDDKDVTTTVGGLNMVKEKAGEMCENIAWDKTITSFAGTRAFCDRHDFVIEESKAVKGLINCAGIESPGLTSAPAIGKFVVEELVSKHFDLRANENFNGKREADDFFKELNTEQKNELIKKEPSYGRIICRCERITEGEIVRAVTTNPRATNVDAVKRRTRAGMGRCQGGFCQIYVAEIISRELGLSLESVTKSGGESYILRGKTK